MENTVKTLIGKAKELLDDGGVVIQSMNETSEWDSAKDVIANVASLYKFVYKVVVAIEEATVLILKETDEFLEIGSEDKLEAAAALVDKYLILPFYLELFDGPAIKIIISFVVTFINDKFGDVWDIVEVKKSIE